jgi:hypothetical protein
MRNKRIKERRDQMKSEEKMSRNEERGKRIKTEEKDEK